MYPFYQQGDYKLLNHCAVIDFSLLVSESAVFLKQVATLQAKTRELRNLLVEMQRELARLTLVRKRLNELIEEAQNTEPAVDFTAAMNDWRQKSDQYFGSRVRAGLAVVSSKV